MERRSVPYTRLMAIACLVEVDHGEDGVRHMAASHGQVG